MRKREQTLLLYQVWRHELGTPRSDDQLVYEEKDDTYHLSVHKTTSDHFILIALFSTNSSEI
nr:Protease 2 [Candidatus Pantoea persica]